MPPLPTRAELEKYLASFDFFERYVHGSAEGHAYVHDHVRRFLATLEGLPPLAPGSKVLELGAVPYYMTILLRRFLDLDVDPVSFYEAESAAVATHVVSSEAYGERYEFPYRALNVERDPFPFPDEQYDLVAVCEILEHLLINPSHTLYESRRVLKPGGYLLVTTPNVLRWKTLRALAEGRNVYDPYIGNGIYGRHNREYTRDEVVELVVANGFTPVRSVLLDVYDPVDVSSLPAAIAALAGPEGPEGRLDTILVLARADGERRMAFPSGLYLLMEEYRNVVWSDVRMGINDGGHLGRGWYPAEFAEGRGCRWSLDRGEVLVRHVEGARRAWITLCAHHPDLASRPVTVHVEIDGREAGTIELDAYGWTDRAIDLPAVSAGPTRSVVLRASRTWQPREAGLDDSRTLGVRVSRVWLE